MSGLLAVSIAQLADFIALIVLLAALLVVRGWQRRKPSAKSPPLKPRWLYWFWRIYVPSVYVGFLLAVGTALLMQAEHVFGWFVIGFALFGAAVMAIMSCYAFPFEYSAFGKRRRTPLPDGPALRTFKNSYGAVGGVRATVPLVTWLLYRQGLGVKISLMGDVFLPWEAIDALELQSGLFSTLYHHYHEVRGPIRLPNLVARTLAKILESQSPDKVIVAAELVNWWNPWRLFQR